MFENAPVEERDPPLETPHVSVVIPCFNEEARIGPTIRSVIHYFESRPWRWEIVVVNDGSGDRTSSQAAAAAENHSNVSIVTAPKNHGKGWAFCLGFRGSRGDLVLLCDADLSTPIEELDSFMDAMDAGCDLVIASRVLEESKILIPQSFRRRAVGSLFRGAVSMLRVTGCADTQCGFKLMRRSSVDDIVEGMRTERFAFDVELLMKSEHKGLRIQEQPVRWSNAAGSKFHILRDGPRTARDLLRIRALRSHLT